MRTELGSTGVGGRNEEWYSVEIDENGEAFYVFEWNYLPYDGPIEKGEKRIPLAVATGEPYYDAAVAVAAAAKSRGAA